MKPVLYIDHIKPAPVGEVIQLGSIIRSRHNNNFVGIVFSIHNGSYSVIALRSSVGEYVYGSSSISTIDSELIKCTLKLKQ